MKECWDAGECVQSLAGRFAKVAQAHGDARYRRAGTPPDDVSGLCHSPGRLATAAFRWVVIDAGAGAAGSLAIADVGGFLPGGGAFSRQ